METLVDSPITLTESAVIEIKRLIEESGFDKTKNCFRLGVKGGGCSGMTYIMEFGKPEVDDDIYDIEGINVIINKSHGMYLFGMEVNYESGLNARGFVFKNPNASKTCGCGSSFAV